MISSQLQPWPQDLRSVPERIGWPRDLQGQTAADEELFVQFSKSVNLFWKIG
jgi:hypothetical protein